MDLDGNRLITYDEIAAEAIRFYVNLLGTPDSFCTGGSVEEIRAHLRYQPSATENYLLLAEVSVAAIHNIIKNFPNNKSPGPDGFTTKFFKHTWPVTELLVGKAIK